ncbi:MAG: exodeoxyribonuclease VII large subunit [Clostridiales bacterium]|nr:exodeoxyribonuclease VII large subunit [Clostridiales bacterium]
MNNKQWILSVAELNEYVRKTLSLDPFLHEVKIRGEISNLKKHSSGHWYFSLKDEKSRIACVMFRQSTYGVVMDAKDGKQVILKGNVSLYTKDGTYQFYAVAMEEEGQGDLHRRFEELKEKLQKEGLFRQERKRPLPLLPRKIGIVTSPTGAVIHDIYQIAMRRFPDIPMVLCPVAVQGEEAAAQIAYGIQRIAQEEEVDVIIVGRGGGAIEDLWPFNEEVVAKAIFQSPVPVVSAVGHETDFTIADFVADARAATPSMAAELVVPIKEDLYFALEKTQSAMEHALMGKWVLLNQQLTELGRRLEKKSPLEYASQLYYKISSLGEKMYYLTSQKLDQNQSQLRAIKEKLKVLNPMSVLERGYSIVQKQGKGIDEASKVQPGDQIQIIMKNGEIQSKVEKVLLFDKTEQKNKEPKRQMEGKQ